MKPDALLVEVQSVFSPGNCQVNINQSCYRLPCKLTDLCLLHYELVYLLGLDFPLFFDLHLRIFPLLRLFRSLRLFNVEPDLTHAVVLAQIFVVSLDGDVLFVDD